MDPGENESDSPAIKYILFLYSIYKWENYVTEKLAKLPRGTVLGSSRTESNSANPALRSYHYSYYHISYILDIRPFSVYASYNNFTIIFLNFLFEMEIFKQIQKETEWYNELLCTHHPVSTIINS